MELILLLKNLHSSSQYTYTIFWTTW